MKFIYYSDSNISPEQVIENCDLSQLLIIQQLSEIPNGIIPEQILLVVLEQPVSDELISWHQNNPSIKVVIFSNSFEDTYLRDLQLEHSLYDLYFKYPLPFSEFEQKVQMISTFTNGVWKSEEINLPRKDNLEISADDLNMPNLEIGNLTDQVNLSSESLTTTEDEKDLNLVSPETPIADALMLETSSSNLEEDLALSTETQAQEKDDVTSAFVLGIENENPSVELGLDLSDASTTAEEQEAADLVMPEDAVTEETIAEQTIPVETITEDALLEETLSNEPLADEVQLDQEYELKSAPVHEDVNKVVEKVSLNEILENKDDQIYRLMSKNKMLEEEITEKEEIIKQVQKELRDHQTQFNNSKNIVEESNYQINVLKSNHEQEKLEIQKHLDMAMSKIKLLETRVEELKKNSSSAQKSSEAILSVSELRKLKARQEHLEEKISLLQNDSAIQLQHREKKIIDLKRKIDLLEFDVKDSIEREAEYKRKIQQAESKMAQMKQVLKQVMDESTSLDETEMIKKSGNYDI